MADIYGDILKSQQKQGFMGGKKALEQSERLEKEREKERSKIPTDKENGAWTFEVYIENGIVMEATDSNGFSDPYVVLVALNADGSKSKQVYRSSVQRKTLEPAWRESGSFALKNSYTQLRVEMWDQDIIGRNEFIGSGVIEIKHSGKLQKHDVVVYKDKEVKSNLTGSVKLQFTKVGAPLM